MTAFFRQELPVTVLPVSYTHLDVYKRQDEAVRVLAENGQEAYFLGEIAKGEEKGVELV